MKPDVQRNKERELNSIWNSLEPCLKDRLISVDSILRKIYSEAQTFGVPRNMIEDTIQKRFWHLASEVSKGA